MRIDSNLCAACQKCINVCPLKLIKQRAFDVEIKEGCNNCKNCLEVCPCGAILED